MTSFLAYGMPALPELLLLLLIGLLLFGKRLPEVGRSLGKGIVEFKRGLRSIDDEVDQASQQPAKPAAVLPPTQAQPQQTAPAFKFDPYTGKPINTDPMAQIAQNSQPPQTSTPVGVSGSQEH